MQSVIKKAKNISQYLKNNGKESPGRSSEDGKYSSSELVSRHFSAPV